MLVTAVVAVSAVSAAPERADAAGTELSARAALAGEIVQDVNRIRRQHGLRPLRVSAGLTRAGEAHARAMAAAGFFAHEGPNGETFDRRIRRFYPVRNARSWLAGENLLWASPDIDAGGSVAAWLESPPHRANLLRAAWTEIGIAAITVDAAPGVFEGRRTTIIVAEFGRRR